MDVLIQSAYEFFLGLPLYPLFPYVILSALLLSLIGLLFRLIRGR